MINYNININIIESISASRYVLILFNTITNRKISDRYCIV